MYKRQDEKGFEWIGAYDITADELLAGTDTAKTESKTAQAQMLILELLADGKRMPCLLYTSCGLVDDVERLKGLHTG